MERGPDGALLGIAGVGVLAVLGPLLFGQQDLTLQGVGIGMILGSVLVFLYRRRKDG